MTPTHRDDPPGEDPAADVEGVPITLSEHRGVRYLHLGTPWVQGAMRLDDPLVLELEYVQRMMAGLLWLDPAGLDDGAAVQLGLGAAALTKFTHRVLRRPTVAVEHNLLVIGACRLWFGLGRDSSRLHVHHGDAAQWVAQPVNHGRARLLHVDLYDHEAAAPVLDDVGFYADCRRVLCEGGVMAVNLFGRSASFERSAARIAAAFAGEGGSPVWHFKPTREGNTIVLAGRGVVPPTRDVLSLRAANIERQWGLPARKWLRLLQPWMPRP